MSYSGPSQSQNSAIASVLLMFGKPIFNSNHFNDPIYHSQMHSCNCSVMKQEEAGARKKLLKLVSLSKPFLCKDNPKKAKIFTSCGQRRLYSLNMICQILTNPNSPSVLSKAKFSSAADRQMFPLRSSTPLATPKPFISLQSEATDSPSDPTAPLQREEHPVLSKGGKFPGAPAHTATVCLLVNVTFTGSQ